MFWPIMVLYSNSNIFVDQNNICFYSHISEKFIDLSIVPVKVPSVSLECEKCLCARQRLGLRTDLSTRILHDSKLFHTNLPIIKRHVPLTYMTLVTYELHMQRHMNYQLKVPRIGRACLFSLVMSQPKDIQGEMYSFKATYLAHSMENFK